jgi:Cellulase (glycosyl hydrolase family 5)
MQAVVDQINANSSGCHCQHIDPVTRRVTRIYAYAGSCCQQAATGYWRYADQTIAWRGPMRHSASPDGTSIATPARPPPLPPGSRYTVSGGRLYDPAGRVFVAAGVNVLDANINTLQPATFRRLFPKANFVRLACGIPGGYADAQPVASIVNWATAMTALGIVVEIESHISDQRDALTGRALRAENAWYASIAKPLANNPRIWFGSENEVGGGVSANHLATYNAVRGAGSSSIFMLCVTKGGPTLADNRAVYGPMHNVAWDLHLYNWMTGGSVDQATVDNYVANYIRAAQGFTTSADGIVPCILGEAGFINYAGDDMNVDVHGGVGTNPVVAAALACAKSGGSGGAIWLWSGRPVGWPTMTDLTVNDTALTDHGQYVNQCIG